MTDPAGLDDLLRAALGGSAHAAGSDTPGGAGLDAARAHVLAGIRRRRLRRMQVAGVGAIVVLGLAVSLPQVLGEAATPKPAPTQASASPAKGGHSALVAPTQVPATPSAQPEVRQAPVASCRADGTTVRGCGALATGSGALALSAAAASLGNDSSTSSFGPEGSVKGVGRALVVRAGTDVVIDLPQVDAGRRWSTPSIAGTRAPAVTSAPVTVRSMPARGATQRFVVTANATTNATTKTSVTVVLESRDDVVSVPTTAPSNAAPSTTAPSKTAPSTTAPVAAWALELEVEGT